MSGFRDHFSGHAAERRRFRPTHPPALAPRFAALRWERAIRMGRV